MNDSIYIKKDVPLRSLLQGYSSVYYLVDSDLGDLFEGFMVGEGMDVQSAREHLYMVPGGEQSKSLEVVSEICGWLLQQGADRSSLLLCFGGGSITDLGGFVAGIYKRGIAVGYVPTTMLALVDAAIGGKTAVNVGGVKNVAGLFREPSFLLVSTYLLERIPDYLILDGAAEAFKMDLIKGKGHLLDLIDLDPKLQRERVIATLRQPHVASYYAGLKDAIVKEDPYEINLRRCLNLGHTFGHAIESMAAAQGEPLSHGRSVALGTCLATAVDNPMKAEKYLTFLSASGIAPEGFDSIKTIMQRFPAQGMLSYILGDKKMSGSKVHFIAVKDGGVEDRLISPDALVEALVNSCKGF